MPAVNLCEGSVLFTPFYFSYKLEYQNNEFLMKSYLYKTQIAEWNSEDRKMVEQRANVRRIKLLGLTYLCDISIYLIEFKSIHK